MAGATLTTVANILKDLYLPPVTEQLNSEVLLLQRVEARSQELVGNQAVLPVHSLRSGGIGSRGEDIDLPTAGNQGYAKATYDLVYNYGRIRVTGPSMAKTRKDVGAFLQTLKGELDGIRNDLKKDVARQLYNDGSAQIAAVASESSDVITLGTGGEEAIRKGQLYVGQIVDIGEVGNYDAQMAAGEITAVTVGTPSITVGSSIFTGTASGNEFVIRSGNAVSSSSIYEMSGLGNLISTSAGSFGGIDASAAGNDYWDNGRDTSGGAFQLNTFQKALNTVRVEGGETSLVTTSFGLRRVAANQLEPQQRFSNTTDLKGGFTSVEINGVPLVADVDHPFGKMYFLDEKTIKIFHDRDWHFLDEDESILKWVTNRDAYEAVLARYMQIGASRRNTNYVISGLTDATGI